MSDIYDDGVVKIANRFVFVLMSGLFVAIVLLCMVLWEVRSLVREAKKDIGGLTSQVSTTLSQVNATELVVSKKAEEQQTALLKVTGSLKLLIDSSNTKLFGRDMKSGVFGQVSTMLNSGNTLVTDLDEAIKEAAKSVVRASDDLHQTIVDLHPSLEALARDLSDPEIQKTLKNLDDASAGLAKDTEQLRVMLVAGSATAEDIKKVADNVAEKYLKTKNLAYALFKELLTLAGSGAQVFK